MTTINLKNIYLSVQAIIQAVGEFQLQAWQEFDAKMIEEKGMHDLVSFVDKESEKQLIAGFRNLIPESNFVAEESGTQQTLEASFTWVIDPLDGTTNFIHKIPIFAISVALFQNNKPLMGFVYAVPQKQMFHAWVGHGAFCGMQPLRVNNQTNMHKCLIATGYPYYNFTYLKVYQAITATLMQNTRGLRRLGAAAVDLAYVAAGNFDAYFEYNLKPWDVAAGIILVFEAGGHVSDFDGTNDFWTGKNIVAASLPIHPQLLAIIKETENNNV